MNFGKPKSASSGSTWEKLKKSIYPTNKAEREKRRKQILDVAIFVASIVAVSVFEKKIQTLLKQHVTINACSLLINKNKQYDSQNYDIFKQFRRAYQDQKLSRQLVRTNQHDNPYYLYYDQNGKHTQKMRMSERIDQMDYLQIHYGRSGLEHQRDKPYIKKENEELVKQLQAQKPNGKQYQQKNEEIMNKFKKNQTKLSMQIIKQIQH